MLRKDQPGADYIGVFSLVTNHFYVFSGNEDKLKCLMKLEGDRQLRRWDTETCSSLTLVVLCL